MIIYLIRNTINGKCYVGQTRCELRKRLWDHKGALNTRRYDHLPLYRAIRKYGWDAFEIEVLEECVDEADMDMAERFWIKTYDALIPSGYNIETGGSRNKRLSAETRTRIGDAHRDKVVSAETRAKQSARRLGRVASQEERANISRGKLLANGLDEQKISAMKRLHEEGVSVRSLARMYPFSRATIARIVSGHVSLST